VEVYDAYAAKITYVDVDIPPGFAQPLVGFGVSSYDFHVWLTNGVRIATAFTVYTDGTARGVQTRDFARVYPGEDAEIEFYGY
jgi:hypothetical protein